ncbi:hypothetical protein [Amycolatopsis sp. CA-126428]|uniref:hypothetical protein n=1 Tax=Amycolatopsis sp. CA-126428 TaxID=2073158 RepID=UPI0011B056FB|nr:hypothetical protein [Amycolatopsis sp. CA-126428]
MRGDVGCPVCGSLDFSCGMATSTTGVDERIEEAPAMAEVREYHVTVNGHQTIMNLSEADAERLGGVPVEPEPEQKRAEAHTKVRAVRNKSEA